MSEPISYKEAGVDIDKAEAFVQSIRSLVKATHRTGVIGELGGFGGLFHLDVEKFRNPVLVSATDGVGTKIKIATLMDRHHTIGIDLVAMCVNDIVVQGAEPLFFLDYYATGKLDIEIAASVIGGIARGCELAGAALVGGETAEMPGMYDTGDYDLAGFSVGIVEKDAIIDGSRVAVGDSLIGLASSGPHSNGYSLIRKIIEVSGSPLDMPFEGSTLAKCLLAPTRIYVKSLLNVMRDFTVKGMAHVTGGGFPGNVPRILPKGVRARIDPSAWPRPPVFPMPLPISGSLPAPKMIRIMIKMIMRN